MLLHAYPLNDSYTPQMYPGTAKEPISAEKPDPVYVKKLEYSADKLAMSSRKHKNSDRKKSEKKPDIKQERSVEVDSRSKGFFESNNKDRRNTLSGQKRT